MRIASLAASAAVVVGTICLPAAPSAADSQQNATAEAQSLVAQVPVVPDSTQRASAPVKRLKRVPETIPSPDTVVVTKYWTSTEPRGDVVHYIDKHLPGSLHWSGDCSRRNRKAPTFIRCALLTPQDQPAGIADADLFVSVTSHNGGSAIAAFGEVLPYPDRQSTEVMPSDPSRVVLALRNSRHPHIDRKRVLATPSATAAIVNAFNAMNVVPNVPRHCPLPPSSYNYVVASIQVDGDRWHTGEGSCQLVTVTRAGQSLPNLDSTHAWRLALQHGVKTGTSEAALEADQLLARSPVLPGATPAASSPAQQLDDPPVGPGFTYGIVTRARYWTTSESDQEVLAYVKSHVPAGMTLGLSCSEANPGPDEIYLAEFDPDQVSNDFDDAELIVAATPLGNGQTGIGAYGVAGTYPPRTADEKAQPPITSVHLVVHRYSDPDHDVRKVTASSRTAQRVVAAFNALREYPPGFVHSCPLQSPDQLVTVVSIRADGHHWQTGSGYCGYVEATEDGTAQPKLADSGHWERLLDNITRQKGS